TAMRSFSVSVNGAALSLRIVIVIVPAAQWRHGEMAPLAVADKPEHFRNQSGLREFALHHLYIGRQRLIRREKHSIGATQLGQFGAGHAGPLHADHVQPAKPGTVAYGHTVRNDVTDHGGKAGKERMMAY